MQATLGRYLKRLRLRQHRRTGTIDGMSEQSGKLPFKNLGQRLRLIRQKLQESAADVSGAVEIDEKTLAGFEEGHERPSEDILNLLISHFGMQDDDAANLLQLAGYDPAPGKEDESDEISSNRAGVLVMAIDPRIIYTDGMHVNAGPNGVVLSFAQMSGSQQPLVTARVGMSREQARSIISTLQASLDKTEPRQLPAGKKTEQKDTAENHATDTPKDQSA
jgi:transcriptional regulator with XRE-family HTH domain